MLALLCLYPLCAAAEELTEPAPAPVHDLPGMLKRYGVAACLTRKMQEAGADPRSMDMARTAQGAYHFLGWGEYGVYPVEAYMEVEAFVDGAQCDALKNEDGTKQDPQRIVLLCCLDMFDSPKAAALLGRYAVPAVPPAIPPKRSAAHARCTEKITDSLLEVHLRMGDTRYAEALPALDTALKTLGRDYHAPASQGTAFIDDTDLKLQAAEDLQRRGQWEKAAQLKRRVLLWRLQMCKAATP